MTNNTVPLAVYKMIFQKWEEEVRRNVRLENAIKRDCMMPIPPGKAKIISINGRERRKQ